MFTFNNIMNKKRKHAKICGFLNDECDFNANDPFLIFKTLAYTFICTRLSREEQEYQVLNKQKINRMKKTNKKFITWKNYVYEPYTNFSWPKEINKADKTFWKDHQYQILNVKLFRKK